MVIQISSSAQKLSSWGSPQADLFESPWGLILDRLFCCSHHLMLKTGSRFCVFIRGKHPVCGEPLFCFSANPDSLSKLCGFHIDHRSRSFLLQVSGISSLLSFCCTSLVSGFIIHIPDRFVYSQSAQGYKHIIVQFLKNSRWNVQNAAFCAVCPDDRTLWRGTLCLAWRAAEEVTTKSRRCTAGRLPVPSSGWCSAAAQNRRTDRF